jgi:3-hydroxybutyryl-CoA dehydratase
VRPGDTVNTTVTVTSVDPQKTRVVLQTVCRVGSTVVVNGEAHLMVSASARRLAQAQAQASAS